MSTLKVKINFAGDYRRVIMDGKTFEEVVAVARREYANIEAEKTEESSLVPLVVKYRDADNDHCTLTSRTFDDWFEEGADVQKTLTIMEGKPSEVACLIGYCQPAASKTASPTVAAAPLAGGATTTTKTVDNLTASSMFDVRGHQGMVAKSLCWGGGSKQAFQPLGPRPLFAMLQVLSCAQSVTTGTLIAMMAHFVPLHIERIQHLLTRFASRFGGGSAAATSVLKSSSLELFPCLQAVCCEMSKRRSAGQMTEIANEVSASDVIQNLRDELTAYASLPLHDRLIIGSDVAEVLKRSWEAIHSKLIELHFPFLMKGEVKRGDLRHWNVVCSECQVRGMEGLRFKSNAQDDFNLCANCYVSSAGQLQQQFTCLVKPCLRMGRGCGKQQQPTLKNLEVKFSDLRRQLSERFSTRSSEAEDLPWKCEPPHGPPPHDSEGMAGGRWGSRCGRMSRMDPMERWHAMRRWRHVMRTMGCDSSGDEMMKGRWGSRCGRMSRMDPMERWQTMRRWRQAMRGESNGDEMMKRRWGSRCGRMSRMRSL